MSNMIKIHNSKTELTQQEYNAALKMFKNNHTVNNVKKKLFPDKSYSFALLVRQTMIFKKEIQKKEWAVKAHESKKLKQNLMQVTENKNNSIVKPKKSEQSLSVLAAKKGPETITINFKGVIIELQKTPKILITENKIIVI